MTTPIQILDGGGSKRRATVTSLGQLVTAPFAYDETKFAELAEDDTAYNFYEPIPNQRFVITGLVAKADKQVGTGTGATMVIYEADSPTNVTESKILLQVELAQGDLLSLVPLNIILNEGVYLNAKTDDDDLHVTLMGYYVPA